MAQCGPARAFEVRLRDRQHRPKGSNRLVSVEHIRAGLQLAAVDWLPALARHLLTYATTEDEDALATTDHDKSIDETDSMLTQLRVPPASVNFFGVRAQAAAAPSQPRNAIAALMHGSSV
jgi:hypothetical protein